MNIFLRELRPFWAKANPDPLPAVKTLANQLSIDLTRYKRNSLTFARLEAGLIRHRHDLARETTRGVNTGKERAADGCTEHAFVKDWNAVI
jgi:hypothetical protein